MSAVQRFREDREQAIREIGATHPGSVYGTTAAGGPVEIRRSVDGDVLAEARALLASIDARRWPTRIYEDVMPNLWAAMASLRAAEQAVIDHEWGRYNEARGVSR